MDKILGKILQQNKTTLYIIGVLIVIFIMYQFSEKLSASISNFWNSLFGSPFDRSAASKTKIDESKLRSDFDPSYWTTQLHHGIYAYNSGNFLSNAQCEIFSNFNNNVNDEEFRAVVKSFNRKYADKDYRNLYEHMDGEYFECSIFDTIYARMEKLGVKY